MVTPRTTAAPGAASILAVCFTTVTGVTVLTVSTAENVLTLKTSSESSIAAVCAAVWSHLMSRRVGTRKFVADELRISNRRELAACNAMTAHWWVTR